MEIGYVYIPASRENGTLYIGVTSDLQGRVSEHKHGIKSGFASKYGATNTTSCATRWITGTAPGDDERGDGAKQAIGRCERSILQMTR